MMYRCAWKNLFSLVNAYTLSDLVESSRCTDKNAGEFANGWGVVSEVFYEHYDWLLLP